MTGYIYLDTNVYNRIADNIAIPIFPGRFGHQWSSKFHLSPLNILEILQIEDDIRRETIVRILQEVCAPDLLAEPEALLVDFIAEHTGLNSLTNLRLESPISVSDLGATWKDIHSDSSKTFIFDERARTNIRQLKLLSKLLHAWHRSGGSFNAKPTGLFGNSRELSAAQIMANIQQTIKTLKAKPISSNKSWPLNDSILILSLCILIVGLTPFPHSIDKLWAALGIKKIEDRISYVLTGPLNFVLSEGPLVGMATIMASQVSKSFSQGNLFDAFHITYLPYIGEMLTLDETLLSFARQYPKSPRYTKVQHAESVLLKIFSDPIINPQSS